MSGQHIKKSELLSLLADKSGLAKANVNVLLDALAEVVTQSVADGNTVVIPGIGKVVSKDRPARIVRNPATGEMIEKEADRTVRISLAKGIKDAVK